MPVDAHITFGPDILRDVDIVFQREWLVTNGLGGYASATLGSASTRRYHGLLVAALRPPLGRAVLLSRLEEVLEIGDVPEQRAYPLSANLYPGTIHPQGYRWLESWQAYPAPTWVWAPEPGIRLEKRVWMPRGRNSVCIAYRLNTLPADCTATLRLTPLLAWKDYHSEMRQTAPPQTARTPDGLLVDLPPIWRITERPTALRLALLHEDGNSYPGIAFKETGYWYYRFQHLRERERGMEGEEDLYTPGEFVAPLHAGEVLIVVASVEPDPEPPPRDTWGALVSRQRALVRASGARDRFTHQLVLAADAFIVQVPGGRSTVIAGYPWFSDWGRDTMIALPGLCLTTGQFEVAREILSSFARHVDRGMLPNRFPDTGETPEYNTVDATLWFFVALYRYIEATGDIATLQQIFWPVLEEILQYHRAGTRYHIHVDERDGLLYAGEPGVQLTWMDARIGDWVITPRIGKPVEINALWHNALRVMQHFAERLDRQPAAARYDAEATRVAEQFTRRFARPDAHGLFDVIDTPSGEADPAVRPNQVFAVSLPFAPLPARSSLARQVVQLVQEELYTPCGLRTLSPRDPAYRPRYEGNPVERDSAYHQGTVWPWLLGPFAEAHYRVFGNREQARALLAPLQTQITVYGVGSLAEVYDGSEPRRPNGCIAQAWSVAETLRVWKQLNPEIEQDFCEPLQNG